MESSKTEVIMATDSLQFTYMTRKRNNAFIYFIAANSSVAICSAPCTHVFYIFAIIRVYALKNICYCFCHLMCEILQVATRAWKAYNCRPHADS